jgi:pyruvate-ferredoxin/flavodoxin oxidoreductase
MISIDGNEAAARIAHKVSEVIAIYPITPSSPMGEWADQWSSEEQTNIWGVVPQVIEMQSEAGAAGAVHGALQAGVMTTTFTASQGLLLMIPNMYKIAGELTTAVFHVAARSLAAQGLSIFGDHSDVMAVRNTGFAMLASASVQEASDMALIATTATLETRVPFLHFFDGFRTSHEVNKVDLISDEIIREMISDELVRAHRARGLSPDNPFIRGTAQNPDVYFQGRESVNPFYNVCPQKVQNSMDKFASLTGRQYHLFDYYGAPDAEKVMVIMGSGAETAITTAEYLAAQGEKVGVVIVRLYRPFASQAFIATLPSSVKSIAVMDRTKEPGAAGEPLYLDISKALMDAYQDGHISQLPKMIGGRYGLSSKEFTPAMVKRIFDELGQAKPQREFTIGINDDVTHLSLDWDPSFMILGPEVVQAVFFGLGADGTVGANKNSIKIISEETDFYTQAYFVYDSKKSGSVTTSHLRFGPAPIRAAYLVEQASFVGCHQFEFVNKFDILRVAAPGATFLLNSPYDTEEVWDKLPRPVQAAIIEKKLNFYVVDGYQVARETGMGGRINTIMQTCFFALSGVLPKDEAIAKIKGAIEKTYGKRGRAVVEQNFTAVDSTLAHLYQVTVPAQVTSTFERPPVVSPSAPDFVQSVTARMIEGLGDNLPVSALPYDGTYPSGTTKYEKRNITTEIPVWDPDICIQCGKCAFVCPHSVIRMKIVEPEAVADAPETFKTTPARFKEYKDQLYTLQVAPEDCTGCSLCVEACPVKNKAQPKFKAINMAPQLPLREQEAENWEFFLGLPEVDRIDLPLNQVKYSQLLEPLFEFSGACAGCGETPYLSLLSRLFGDRTVVANATGCSSIYGGNLPTTPWTMNAQGRGPAWSNSLFEDNAEFGLGMRVALDQRQATAVSLLQNLREVVGAELADGLLTAVDNQPDEAAINQQRGRVDQLKNRINELLTNEPALTANLELLLSLADNLVKKSLWIVGGDGWAFDIGFGGLDHVLASGRNVNILVLDTEVYSNTGGQASKATPIGAVAKFAAAGKSATRKDLGFIAMSYGNVYVAEIAFGANDKQTIQAFLEAEAYDGPSLIIAYSHCVAHGYDLKFGLEQQTAAVNAGYWALYRYNPELALAGENPFKLDSRRPSIPLEQFIYREGRFRMLAQSNPERAAMLLEMAKKDVETHWQRYDHMLEYGD